MISELAALAVGVTVPLVMSKRRAGNVLSDKQARDVAFYTTIGAGIGSVALGSSTLGALALGSGGAWAAMKGDDLVRALP